MFQEGCKIRYSTEVSLPYVMHGQSKRDQRKDFSFQDCILKCNDFQSLPAKCFRIVIKSLELWSYNNIKLHGLTVKVSELESFSNSQSLSWYLQACSLAPTSKQACVDRESGFATTSQASQSGGRLPWKKFMSAKFISWDRFQIGTQEVSKVLKKFHRLGLKWTWYKIQGSLTAWNKQEKIFACSRAPFWWKEKTPLGRSKIQRQTKIHRQCQRIMLTPNFKCPVSI